MPEASAASVARSPGQPEADEVLGQQQLANRAASSGSFRRSHISFGAWKPVLARLPVIAITRSAPDPPVDLGALGLRARVVPEQRRPDRRTVLVDEHRAVHLAGEAKGHDLVPRRGGRELTQRGHRTLPPVFRLLLGPAGSRRQQGIAGVGAGDHAASGRQGHALGTAGADIDSDGDRLAVHGCTSLARCGRSTLRRSGRRL